MKQASSIAIGRRGLAATGAIFGAMLTVIAFYPGFMSWDSLNQYEIALSGVYNDWHPPIMSWTWQWLNRLFDGPQGMLFFHVALLWGGLYLWCRAAADKRWSLAFLLVGVAPWILNLAGVLWKDVGVAFALGAATALGLQRFTIPRLLASAMLVFYAIALRHNTMAALPPLLLFLWNRWWPSGAFWKRMVGSVASLVLLAVAVSGFNYGLLQATKTNPQNYIVIDDLAYLSLYEGRSLLPNVSMDDIRHCAVKELGQNKLVGRSFCLTEKARGLSLVSEETPSQWRDAIIAQPAAYVRYRLASFAYLLRSPVDAPYYIWHPGIDPNTLKLSQTDNAATAGVHRYVVGAAAVAPALFKPYWWAAFACSLFVAGLLCTSSPSRDCVLTLAASALAYLLGYLPTTPMADLRYVYWSMYALTLGGVLYIVACRWDHARWRRWRWPATGAVAAAFFVFANLRQWFDISIDEVVWRSVAARAVPVQALPRVAVGLTAQRDMLRVTAATAYVAQEMRIPYPNPASIEYLAFEFECVGRKSMPNLQFLWWGGDRTAPEPSQGTLFRAQQGINLVSTTALSGWSDALSIKGFSTQISSTKACESIWIGPLLAVVAGY